MSYRDMKKELIHPWERPTRVINIIITIIVIIVAIASLFDYLDSANFDALSSGDVAALEDQSFGIAGAIFGGAFIILIVLGKQYGDTLSRAIEVNEYQFPEVYDIVVDFSQRLEMGYVPKVFLMQNGGVINAFATSFFRRRYICINSDIFDVAYLEHRDMDALAFIIGHELTHLKRKHATTMMQFLETIPRLIPVYGSAVSRVREYTCDRHAVWLVPEGREGIVLLAAGKHLYKKVDVEAYLKTAKPYKSIFMWYANFMASHPIIPKRIRAVMDTSKWGRVF